MIWGFFDAQKLPSTNSDEEEGEGGEEGGKLFLNCQIVLSENLSNLLLGCHWSFACEEVKSSEEESCEVARRTQPSPSSPSSASTGSSSWTSPNLKYISSINHSYAVTPSIPSLRTDKNLTEEAQPKVVPFAKEENTSFLTFHFGAFLILGHFWFRDTFDFEVLLIWGHFRFWGIYYFGYFWFWGTFDFGELLILGHFWFWGTFDFGALLILGNFLFWGTFGFVALLILGHFWFWGNFILGHLT